MNLNSKQYYSASLYILGYLALSGLLYFVFSFMDFSLNYPSDNPLLQAATSLVLAALAVFGFYKLLHKSKQGLYAGFLFYGIKIVSVIGFYAIIYLPYYSWIDISDLSWILSHDFPSLILWAVLLYALWKSRPELN